MKDKMNPYELLYMCHMGDECARRAIVEDYRQTAEYIVSNMLATQTSMKGYRDDLIQEALIAISEAVDLYREDRDSSFRTFVSLVIRRKVWKMLKHYRTIGFGQEDSLDKQLSDDMTLQDRLVSTNKMLDPEYVFRYHMAESNMKSAYASLTSQEKEIYHAWMDGISYKDGAEKFHCTQRAYEGKLRRIKQKVRDSLAMNGITERADLQ